jgi:hypothetical protein
MRRTGWAAAAVSIAILTSCSPKQSASLHISTALESLVPADTVALLGINLAALRDAPIYQKLTARVPLPQLDEFQKQTGLDPRKDFSEALLCSNGKSGLLLVRGKFRPADLESRFKANGVKPADYKGHAVYGDERAAISLINDDTAAAAPPAELHALIDRGTSGSALPAGLRDQLRTLPAGDQVYAAFTGSLEQMNLPLPREGNLGNVLQALKSVNSAALGLNLNQGIDGLAEVNCTTERDAKFIHDMLRGLIGFGRLRTPDNQPEMLKLYDSIQVTQQQTQAKVTANVPQELADKFLDLWLKP